MTHVITLYILTNITPIGGDGGGDRVGLQVAVVDLLGAADAARAAATAALGGRGGGGGGETLRVLLLVVPKDGLGVGQ